MTEICSCNHDAARLVSDIRNGLEVQRWDIAGDKVALVCGTCGGLWDHAVTQRIFDHVVWQTTKNAENAEKSPDPSD